MNEVEEALNVVSHAAAQASMPLMAHNEAQKAVQFLKGHIAALETKLKEVEKPKEA
jgi:FtsZ-interacting cell division protein YlmF